MKIIKCLILFVVTLAKGIGNGYPLGGIITTPGTYTITNVDCLKICSYNFVDILVGPSGVFNLGFFITIYGILQHYISVNYP